MEAVPRQGATAREGLKNLHRKSVKGRKTGFLPTTPYPDSVLMPIPLLTVAE